MLFLSLAEGYMRRLIPSCVCQLNMKLQPGDAKFSLALNWKQSETASLVNLVVLFALGFSMDFKIKLDLTF